ncbi:MAG: formate dehydrogenase [Rhodospirillales bacterium]|nr:formate dehydrogenase [Rhodospirillales bacterium]
MYGSKQVSPSRPIELSTPVGDETKTTTCYMCACRCGIKVHLQDGQVRYIEGNRDHPVNRGVLCAKGAAGIMQHTSPARLRKPLKRVGPRGEGPFVEIEWEEALATATGWLQRIRSTDPRKLAFFTGRDQSQAMTGWWAREFGTPNYAAHGGFCSVNMAAGGFYSIGGSFWEFGEPDWEHAKYLLMLGVAEDHSSNPIKIGLGKLKGRGAKFVSVNPIRTGYSAIADEWVGIRPGTDGLWIMSLIHELLKAGAIDFDYLVRYTNAPWLVYHGGDEDGLFVRDAKGRPQAWDAKIGAIADALAPDITPSLTGEAKLADGRRAVPAFRLLAERFVDARYAPDAIAETTGVSAATTKRIAAELAHVAFSEAITLDVPWTDWAGRRHEKTVGRPISIHAMRGISAHSNGFHTCFAIHVLQMLLGAIDCPGGFRYRPPFPKAIPAGRPAGKFRDIAPGKALSGMPLGFPMGPEDLLVTPEGDAVRIDKAFSWEYPLAGHGLLHMVISNAYRGDPYPIDTLMMFMANMTWNSAMNTGGTVDMLTERDPATGEYKIPHIIYADAYLSEMVAYADLILPDTTYLERHDCISILDRPISEADAVQDAIRQPVVAPDRDVRPFQSVLLDLGARLGLPGMVTAEGTPRYADYADYIVNHERSPGIGLLMGWRGKGGASHISGAPNPEQLDRYIENGCFFRYKLPPEHQYFRMANKGYLEWATSVGFAPNPDQIILQIYSEPLQRFRLAASGIGPIQAPKAHRARIKTYFDPLPFWYPPFEEATVGKEFPFHAVTQRPMHMYQSWGSQNAWLRQITSSNQIYIHKDRAAELGIADNDWVWIISHHSRVKAQAALTSGQNADTVWTWNAIGKRRGAWRLDADAPESTRGFLLNHVISELLPDRGGYRYANADPVTGQAAWFDLRVRIEKAEPDDAQQTEPAMAELPSMPGMRAAPKILTYGQQFRDRRTKS